MGPPPLLHSWGLLTWGAERPARSKPWESPRGHTASVDRLSRVPDGSFFFFSVLGLCWFLCLRRGGLLFVAVHSSRHAGFSSCGLQTLEQGSVVAEHRQLPCSMWDLPRPGIKPMSPTLKGGFSATVSPGKSSVGHYHHGFQLFDPRRPTHLSFPGCTPRSWREII